ncbi:MAG: gamma-aminobutyraldehyde dehydrogenase [Acidimicrobiales bacterium]
MSQTSAGNRPRLSAAAGGELQNLVHGTWSPPASGRTTPVVDPCTGSVYAEAPLSGPEDVDAACRSAAQAFEAWRDTTPSHRQRLLLALADAVEAHADELVAGECANTGKPVGLTTSEEMPPAIDQIRFFAGAARCLEGRAAGEYMEGYTSWLRREPVGVVAQVTPWNYPLMMAIWKISPALAAGNTVVLKPSETTPVTTLMLAELANGIFPPGVLNVICGDRETGKALVAHPVPRMVAITGSVRAGREVAQAASADVKRVHLELGGKAPVIVFGDVDAASVAEAIAMAGYFNAGQDCTAATRVLAEPRVYDDLVASLGDAAGKTRTGDLGDGDAAFGPLNNNDQLGRVEGFMERLPGHVQVVAGGKRLARPGYFFPATVLSGVEPDDEVAQTEIFGPVVTVQRFSDEAQAVAWANSVEYGLASSVWTKDHARALRVSRQLDFGCEWINTHIPLVAELPHGGFKHSGYGKDLSMYGFEDYTRIKHVMSSLD